DHIQITAAEESGVEHRRNYYEGTGCLRDMFPERLLQLLSILAMEPPTQNNKKSIRKCRANALKAIVPLNPAQPGDVAVRGQYGSGVIHGVHVRGYREETGASPHSHVETFVAMKLSLDNSRWRGVPFYLRAGKRMPQKRTEVVIQFKPGPHLLSDL